MRTILALTMLVLTLPAAADKPLPPPSVVTICSANGRYCATADPKLDAVIVHPRGERDKPLWRLKGWERSFHLADDGAHLVVCFSGLNLLPLDYRPDWVLLKFYERDRLLRQWSVRELIPAPTRLRRTASHYEWGGCAGFVADGSFEVRTVDRGTLRFDAVSGRLLR